MRKLLSLAFGWIFVACAVVAVISVAIGDWGGAAAAGFVAFIFLAISGILSPRSVAPGPSVNQHGQPTEDAKSQAETKQKAKRKADERRRRIRREEEEMAQQFHAEEQQRRQRDNSW